MRTNLNESELFALDIATAVAKLAAERPMANPGFQPWQVRKFCRITRPHKGTVRIVLGMHCLPSEVDIIVRQSDGKNDRLATFEGKITPPGVPVSRTNISGTAQRTFYGVVEITQLNGLPKPDHSSANSAQS